MKSNCSLVPCILLELVATKGQVAGLISGIYCLTRSLTLEHTAEIDQVAGKTCVFACRIPSRISLHNSLRIHKVQFMFNHINIGLIVEVAYILDVFFILQLHFMDCRSLFGNCQKLPNRSKHDDSLNELKKYITPCFYFIALI